jgi:hypothetical protein
LRKTKSRNLEKITSKSEGNNTHESKLKKEDFLINYNKPPKEYQSRNGLSNSIHSFRKRKANSAKLLKRIGSLEKCNENINDFEFSLSNFSNTKKNPAENNLSHLLTNRSKYSCDSSAYLNNKISPYTNVKVSEDKAYDQRLFYNRTSNFYSEDKENSTANSKEPRSQTHCNIIKIKKFFDTESIKIRKMGIKGKNNDAEFLGLSPNTNKIDMKHSLNIKENEHEIFNRNKIDICNKLEETEVIKFDNPNLESYKSYNIQNKHNKTLDTRKRSLFDSSLIKKTTYNRKVKSASPRLAYEIADNFESNYTLDSKRSSPEKKYNLGSVQNEKDMNFKELDSEKSNEQEINDQMNDLYEKSLKDNDEKLSQINDCEKINLDFSCLLKNIKIYKDKQENDNDDKATMFLTLPFSGVSDSVDDQLEATKKGENIHHIGDVSNENESIKITHSFENKIFNPSMNHDNSECIKEDLDEQVKVENQSDLNNEHNSTLVDKRLINELKSINELSDNKEVKSAKYRKENEELNQSRIIDLNLTYLLKDISSDENEVPFLHRNSLFPEERKENLTVETIYFLNESSKNDFKEVFDSSNTQNNEQANKIGEKPLTEADFPFNTPEVSKQISVGNLSKSDVVENGNLDVTLISNKNETNVQKSLSSNKINDNDSSKIEEPRISNISTNTLQKIEMKTKNIPIKVSKENQIETKKTINESNLSKKHSNSVKIKSKSNVDKTLLFKKKPSHVIYTTNKENLKLRKQQTVNDPNNKPIQSEIPEEKKYNEQNFTELNSSRVNQ